MAKIVEIGSNPRKVHLYWKGDHRRFVTCCEDGSVILDGKVMSLEKATQILLMESGMPASFFWD